MTNTTAGGASHEEFEAARKAATEAYTNFLDAKQHLKKAALAAGVDFKESANEQIEEAVSKARDKKNELQKTASDYVRENPLTSAGLAFLGGVIVARLFGK